MFKLSQIRDAHTAVMTLHDPVTGVALPPTITLMSRDNPKARAQAFETERSKRAKASKSRIAQDDPEADWARHIDRLVVMTVAWTDIFEEDGTPIQCTPENVRRVYEGVNWIHDQVLDFVTNSANFIVRSASSSSITLAPPSA